MSSIFDNIDQNKVMLEGSYKKLKSYYYYNKNFLYLRKKVAEFEYDLLEMDKKFIELAILLEKPELKKNVELVNHLINQIDFYVLPKSFEGVKSKKKWFQIL